MKLSPGKFGIMILAVMFVATAVSVSAEEYPNIPKEIKIKRGFTKEALNCIECHATKMSGTVEGWKTSRMSHAGVSCYDCHVVEKSSPMASQCEGTKGTGIYISPMVSSKTCSRCHPQEVEQFLKSGHAEIASGAVTSPKRAGLSKLQFYYEGGGYMTKKQFTWKLGTPAEATDIERAPRASGCQPCHGSTVELDENNKPKHETWPGGVGTRYPDGSIGTCTVCHERHTFSKADARKPEACGACHLGPDHPNIEIYHESKHGQLYITQGDKWNFDSPPDVWEPGDYTAPTCATCHMSGIGDLATTHNVQERLKWDLMHKKSVVRSGDRGEGVKGEQNMRRVCANCHGTSHTKAQRDMLDNAVGLYNKYWAGAVKMKQELADKQLLGPDPWQDGYQELMYYLWHHVGRRARQGAAMNAPDYAHWHGFFQLFQCYQDMENIYKMRIETGKVEKYSPVLSSAPY